MLRKTVSLACLVAACAGGQVDPREGPDASPPQDAADVAMQDSVGPDRTSPSDASAPDDQPSLPDALAGDAAVCTGNRDGVIDRREMAFLLGATALYAVNRPGTIVEMIDTTARASGSTRVWDFSAAHPNDTRVVDEVLSPRGMWWASSYGDASFAALLDRASNLLGVYRVSETSLELLGTVSTEANRTNLRFTPPVTVLRFPLRVGASWEQTVHGTGFVNFTPLNNVTRYATVIDSAGEVWTPVGRFPALRMRTDLDQAIPLTVFRVTRRTFTFLSECWGVVARVTSVDNETSQELRRASEYRRLGL